MDWEHGVHGGVGSTLGLLSLLLHLGPVRLRGSSATAKNQLDPRNRYKEGHEQQQGFRWAVIL